MNKKYVIMSSCKLSDGTLLSKPLEETEDPMKAARIKNEYQSELGVMYRVWVDVVKEEEEPFPLVVRKDA